MKFRLIDLHYGERHTKDLDEEWVLLTMKNGKNMHKRCIDLDDFVPEDWIPGTMYEIEIDANTKLADEDVQTVATIKEAVRERKAANLENWMKV